MADINTENSKPKLSEEEIDDLIVAQADDDSAWERPIKEGEVRFSHPAH